LLVVLTFRLSYEAGHLASLKANSAPLLRTAIDMYEAALHQSATTVYG
jgi:hypothetical protein